MENPARGSPLPPEHGSPDTSDLILNWAALCPGGTVKELGLGSHPGPHDAESAISWGLETRLAPHRSQAEKNTETRLRTGHLA
jgi:hypothetical protein